MPFFIRPAELDDLPAILEIEQQSPVAAHWTAEQYKAVLGSGVILVTEQTGKLCGFLCATAAAEDWEIENMAVHADFQRRGIADQLVRALIQRAGSTSASAILLEVRESNQPARRLYKKHGFREEGRRRAYYNHPLDDAILCAFRFAR
jgi:[ribosomal protein S18]-alanine N-acetyltransferase